MPEICAHVPEAITRPGQTAVEVLLGVYALGEECAKSVAMCCWQKLPHTRRLEIQKESTELSGGDLAASAACASALLVLEYATNDDVRLVA